MHQIASKISKALLYLLLSVVVLFALLIGSLQTRAAKEWMRDKVLTIAKNAGITMSLGKVQGPMPLFWSVEKVSINITPSQTISFHTAKMQLSPITFFGKGLHIAKLHIPTALLSFDSSLEEAPKFYLPGTFSLHKLHIENLIIEDRALAIQSQWRVNGEGNFRLATKAFFLDLFFTSKDIEKCTLFLSAEGDPSNETFSLAAGGKLPTLKPLAPYTQPKFDLNGTFTFNCSGKWQSFVALFPKVYTRDPLPPLSGSVKWELFSLSLPDETFTFEKGVGNSEFSLYDDWLLHLNSLLFESPILHLKGDATIVNREELRDFSLKFLFPDVSAFTRLSPFPIHGELHGSALYDKQQFQTNCTTTNLKVDDLNFQTIDSTLKIDMSEPQWKGEFAGAIQQENFPAQFSGKIDLIPYETWEVRDLFLSGPETMVTGVLAYHFRDNSLDGNVYASLGRLGLFSSFLEGVNLGGSAWGKFSLEKQRLLAEVSSSHIRVGDISAETLYTRFKIDELFGHKEATFSLDAENVTYKEIQCHTLFLHSFYSPEKNPFTLSARGNWKGGFEIETSGYWQDSPFQTALGIDKLDGYLLKKTFHSKGPFALTMRPDAIHLSPFHIIYSLGEIQGSFMSTPTRSSLSCDATHFPLELLTLTHPNLAFSGTMTLHADLVQKEKKEAVGPLHFIIEDSQISSRDGHPIVDIAGSFHSTFENEGVDLIAQLQGNHEESFQFQASLPATLSLSPVSLHISKNAPLLAKMEAEGNLRELVGFFDIGSHTIEAHVNSQLVAKGTFASPELTGYLKIQDGVYENYATGTTFTQIEAAIEGEDEKLLLKEFHARGKKKGTLDAEGEMLFSLEEGFPFTVHLDANALPTFNLDLLSATTTGHLAIEGNIEGAKAQGDLKINRAEIELSESFTDDIPDLPITYVNPPPAVESTPLFTKALFPLELDIQTHSDGKVSLIGHGLRSEWKGDVAVQGTLSEIIPRGSLKLVHGDFSLFGKRFYLTEGNIRFKNKETIISVEGSLDLPDATITINLQGPVNNPYLQLKSNPHMPTSAILARILFNKDIAEISPIQAVQLAQALITLSGSTGPDVLEKIRRSIGVDRLSIVSTGTDSEEVAVQIGKYITQGVMITLNQGLDSTNVVVEVELKGGFLFQAETQDEGEGKFTLKWNLNY